MAQITDKYGECDSFKYQYLIGWTNFMIGRMVPEWAATQQSYDDWLKKKEH
jgi:hypothetical protein